MTFALQKIIWFLIIPPASLLTLILIGLLLLRRNNRLGKSFILCGLFLIYLLSLGHIADLILKPLEGRYPPLRSEHIVADAVVVPGGGSVDLDWLGAAPAPNAETTARLIMGVELARKLRVPLILCGGNGEPFATKVNDADAMATAVFALGMNRKQIIIENVSRNTLENSYAVRKLIKGDRIVLATSAYYMRRATALFERRGFTVIPAPVYFLAQSRIFSYASFIPKAVDLSHSTIGIAEWLSLFWWHARGEI